MKERIVTTIGDLGADRAPVRIRRRSRFADDLDQMLGISGIGEFVLKLPVGEGTEDPGTIVLPETVITPEEDVTPDEWSSEVGPAVISNPKASTPSKVAWSRGDGSYILQNGDTLWGLASTYLSSGPRWREIWNAQTPAYKSAHTPDRIYAGEVIAMTSAAQAKARALGLYGIGSQVLGRGFSRMQVAVAGAGIVGLATLAHFVGKAT